MPSSFTLPLLCALLRGEAPAWPTDADAAALADFLRAARYHGVTALVDARLRALHPTTGQSDGHHEVAPPAWPEAIRRACHEDALLQAMHEVLRRRELQRVLERFAQHGIAPLILKGGALAYTHYAAPALRPRGDTDLFIPASRAREAGALLAAQGYARNRGVTGELIAYQATWSRADAAGIDHDLDLHWRISNSQILAKLLTYDELAARSVPLPALGPSARAPCAVHALLFACMHRAGHANAPYFVDGHAYLGVDRLIWLYDMHLLVTRMRAAELHEFVGLAARKRVRTICRDALANCVEAFATPIQASHVAALAPDGDVEPSARYLSGGRARQMVGDFLALDGAAQRARWLKELAFPSAEYIRDKYPESPKQWLPVLYARRGFHGLWRLASRASSDERH